MSSKLAAIEPAWAPRPAAAGAAASSSSCSTRDGGPGAAGSLERLLGALTSGDPLSREGACRRLAELGDPRAIPALRSRLEDESKPVRSAAAVALSRLGDRAVIAEMIKGLSDPSPRNVAGCALGLGLSRRPEAVAPLLAAFKTHDTCVGAAVAHALGLIGDPRATPALLQALKAGFVPADACDALGRLADPAAAPALVKGLRHPDGKVRSRAARALGALKDVLQGPARDKARQALHKVLSTEPNPKLRLAAALSLHELGDREGSAQVLAALQGSQRPRPR